MLKSWLARLSGRSPAFPPVAPEHPFYLIGDIHGRADLLDRALKRLEADHPVVFVGDYIDRGEDSAGVLRALIDRPNAHFLKGNHEEMLLSFLGDPITHGPRWLRYGGLQTLASYGVAGVTETSKGPELEAVRDALTRAMGPEQIFWLRTLPLTYRSGNVAVVHAGADPRLDPDSQDSGNLIWGHKDFGRVPRRDGLWIAHGHTIVDEPVAERGIISVDTGAYATGRLSVAAIREGGVEFLDIR
ncbi:serine/threonine protein phosphatase [Ruegeria sediminis]|uniref:Serine/threonine protein phosphatase n=1 Tax=Ruegeria sediminis TaxID=2583820 RepID=A0ABY2WVQ4_9RHOB|nr:metallophosphoesterase family protein [Ruegeria sediminis]TMV05608.1 serine/threonine protein phosphatase [Ruegeria sediminis]